MKTRLRLSAVLFIFIFISSTAPATPVACGFPPRTGSAAWSSPGFYAQHQLPSSARDLAVIEQVMAGNIPDRLRQFKAVRVPGKYHAANVMLEVMVAPDYLAIGTDQDFVRTPLTDYAAQYLASELGLVMPTAFLVDQIYAKADVKMTPQPTDWYKKDITMRYGSNYIVFNQTLEAQRGGRTGLIAGHKKDVVLTNLLDHAPTKVAIYGWQMPGGHPIQPLGTPHDYAYEDYSHGIRYLGPALRILTMGGNLIDEVPLPAALMNTELGASLNGGQAIRDTRAGRTCDAAFAQGVGLGGALCPPAIRICPIPAQYVGTPSKDLATSEN